MDQHEFMAEMPALELRWLKTGQKVEQAGAYACLTCGDSKHPPMVVLEKGDRVPPCAACGPETRWTLV